MTADQGPPLDQAVPYLLTDTARHALHHGLTDRLARIADLLAPCPAPDIAGGHDLCPCRNGGTSWPCATTQAAWLALGVDPDTETRVACRAADAQMYAQGEDRWPW